jgi:hypothetical protein
MSGTGKDRPDQHRRVLTFLTDRRADNPAQAAPQRSGAVAVALSPLDGSRPAASSPDPAAREIADTAGQIDAPRSPLAGARTARDRGDERFLTARRAWDRDRFYEMALSVYRTP